MTKRVQPKVHIGNESVKVSYVTKWNTVIEKPPIEYDTETRVTNVGSNTKIEGDLTATGKVYNAVWNDYAELFRCDTKLSPGTVVSYIPNSNGKVEPSTSNNEDLVVGVVSDNYGMVLGGDKGKTLSENLRTHVPVGLVGRVDVLIDDKSLIHAKPGSLLGISTTNPGYATVLLSRSITDVVIGKVLEYPKGNTVLMLICQR